MTAPAVGAFALHLPTGRAGRVVRVHPPGTYRAPGAPDAADPVDEECVELSTGDVYLAVSREERAGELGSSWLALPAEHEAGAVDFWEYARAQLFRVRARSVQVGLPARWAHALAASLVREVVPPT